ncbi:uncharacterized protein A4U43_C04F27870, partial [Asparagus officinalis]
MRGDEVSASAASSSATTTSDGLELDRDSPRAGHGFTSICWRLALQGLRLDPGIAGFGLPALRLGFLRRGSLNAGCSAE